MINVIISSYYEDALVEFKKSFVLYKSINLINKYARFDFVIDSREFQNNLSIVFSFESIKYRLKTTSRNNILFINSRHFHIFFSPHPKLKLNLPIDYVK